MADLNGNGIRLLKDLEKDEISKAVGVMSKREAADALGISLKTLYNKLHQYALAGDVVRPRAKSKKLLTVEDHA